jgi:hypothetical protein
VQLDNTRIAVRERGMIDTYDLTLHVIRNFAPRLVPALLLGILPLALLNELLLWGVWTQPEAVDWMEPESVFQAIATVPLMQGTAMTRYGWLYLMLVFFEAPVATIFAESYLGAAVFKQEKTLWDSVRDVFSLSHRPHPTAPREVGPFWAFLLCQLLMRGTLLAMIVPILVWGEEFNGWLEIGLLLLLFVFVAALRAFRPYINEIIVLEKNPLWSKTAPMTVGKRSGNLHISAGGELFGQWLGSCFAAFVLLQIMFWSMWLIYSVMFGDSFEGIMGWVPQHVIRPLALWSVVAYLGVARFLSYLDLRIRQEGWEVELLIRAEAGRLAEKLV